MRWLLLAAVVLAVIVPASTAHARWIWTPETGWVDTEQYEGGDPQKMLDNANALMQAGKFSDAATEYTRIGWFSLDDTIREKAMSARIDAYLKSDNSFYALRASQDYMEQYPATAGLKVMIQKQFDIAFELARRGKKDFLGTGIYIFSAKEAGLEAVKQLLERYPYDDFSDKYAFALADFYYEDGEYAKASAEFELFLKSYPDSSWAPTATHRLALAEIARFDGLDYDDEALKKSKKVLRKYLTEFPEAEGVQDVARRLAQVEETQAEKDYRVAMFYLGRDKAKSALVYFKAIVKEYPETATAEKARRQVAAIEKGDRIEDEENDR
jgi:outer membrane assembly lipoprotein YfiO